MQNVFKIIADYASSYDDVKNKISDATADGNLSRNPAGIINVFLYIGGMAAIVMIIVAGIQMTTSAGNPGAVSKAKTTLIWSIIGLVVMLLAYALVNFVILRVDA